MSALFVSYQFINEKGKFGCGYVCIADTDPPDNWQEVTALIERLEDNVSKQMVTLTNWIVLPERNLPVGDGA